MAPVSSFIALWAALQPLARALPAPAPVPVPGPVPGPVPEAAGIAASPRPFYAIAHRVIMDYGVRDALKNGANALEMDVTAWKDQWYADHDGTITSKGDPTEKMFKAVAEQRRAGKNVLFVWLDIKNPDYCNESSPKCNIEALRKLARDILHPAGVRVLYGFYNDQGRAYRLIRDGLNDNEAINLDGNSDDVRRSFETGGPANVRKRVMSRGLFRPWFRFGDCSDTDSNKICPQLRKAVQSGAFGKVFGWTVSKNEKTNAERMMDIGVDGLIYGSVMTHYYDNDSNRKAFSYIKDWLARNGDKRYLAGANDKPW